MSKRNAAPVLKSARTPDEVYWDFLVTEDVKEQMQTEGIHIGPNPAAALKVGDVYRVSLKRLGTPHLH